MLHKSSNRILLKAGLFLFLLPVMVVFVGELKAADMELRDGVIGFWFQPNEQETPDFTWQANWIWLDDSLNYDVLLTRKAFNLSEVPQNCMLRITASSKFQ